MNKLHFRLLGVVLSLFIASCSFFEKDRVSYDVEEDAETGILYNQEWEEKYDAKTAYYNETSGLLNVRIGPGQDYRVIAYLKPREGGFIQSCNFDLGWCYMNFGGKPDAGWVDMRFLTQGQIEYTQ